jgi:branched-chain amino acid aminotransferase
MVTTFFIAEITNGVKQLGEYVDMRSAADALPGGAYTTFRTYHSDRILHLEQHFLRLEDSLALMGKTAKLNRAQAKNMITHALAHTHYTESRFRLTFTPAGLFTSIEAFTPYPDVVYETGVSCVTVPIRRDNPLAKSTQFNVTAHSAYKTLPAHIHEALMVDSDGAILEGLSSNFFALLPHNDASGQAVCLFTEESNALMGVTRSLVLSLAQPLVEIVRRAPMLSQLPHIRECFITSVSREIMPVVKINDRIIGDGKPGEITRRLMQKLAALIEHEAVAI